MIYTQSGVTGAVLTPRNGNAWQWLMAYAGEPQKVPPAVLEDPEKIERYKRQHARYFIAGEIEKDQNGHYKRSNATLKTRDVLALDFDEIDATPDEFMAAVRQSDLAHYAYMLYPTIRHTAKAPRFRLIVPLERPATKGEYLATMAHVGSLLKPFISDTSATTWSQLQGLPLDIGRDIYAMYSTTHKGAAHPVVPADTTNVADLDHARQARTRTNGRQAQGKRKKGPKPSHMDDLAHFISIYGAGIDEGNRDNWLTSVAGVTLKRDGVHLADALEFLHGINKGFCRPPLSERDVERIFYSIATKELQKRKGEYRT